MRFRDELRANSRPLVSAFNWLVPTKQITVIDLGLGQPTMVWQSIRWLGRDWRRKPRFDLLKAATSPESPRSEARD